MLKGKNKIAGEQSWSVPSPPPPPPSSPYSSPPYDVATITGRKKAVLSHDEGVIFLEGRGRKLRRKILKIEEKKQQPVLFFSLSPQNYYFLVMIFKQTLKRLMGEGLGNYKNVIFSAPKNRDDGLDPFNLRWTPALNDLAFWKTVYKWCFRVVLVFVFRSVIDILNYWVSPF